MTHHAPSASTRPHTQTPSGAVARLALTDGTVVSGPAFGAVGRGVTSVAELVFNTALTGYQESLTDPSYTGQILVQTFPLIGNTGVNPEDVESVKVQVAGFVVRELAREFSNFRATQSLSDYLAHAGVLGIAGVDTRRLTRVLRAGGSTQAVLTDRTDLSSADLVALARNAPSMAGQNLVPRVGCASGQTWTETLGDWAGDAKPSGTKPLRVLALDCGAKRNILRNLTSRGCDVKVVPHDTKAADIRAMYQRGEIDGLFISNGPGDPAAVEATVATLRDIIKDEQGPSIPTFGICLGHQLLALAAGAKTFKLKFGHRGTNQPIANIAAVRDGSARPAGKVEITSQNHGFAVDPASLESIGGRATHTHLNDGTLAGFRLVSRPVFAVQYHPEASPGPHDAGYLFDEFVGSMRDARARA